MRIFKDCEFKEDCPVCGLRHKGDAVLIGIDGTVEGNNIQAKLFHLDCLELRYYEDNNLIAQKVFK